MLCISYSFSIDVCTVHRYLVNDLFHYFFDSLRGYFYPLRVIDFFFTSYVQAVYKYLYIANSQELDCTPVGTV